MVTILDFICVTNFWQNIIVFFVFFDLWLFGFSLEICFPYSAVQYGKYKC